MPSNDLRSVARNELVVEPVASELKDSCRELYGDQNFRIILSVKIGVMLCLYDCLGWLPSVKNIRGLVSLRRHSGEGVLFRGQSLK